MAETVTSTSTARFFDTAHLHADLKERSIRGGVVTFCGQFAKLLIQIGSTAMLARLLTPSDFGVVAMVSAVTGFFGSLGDLGLSSATIQRTEVTHEQVSTLFWINIAVSLFISVVFACLAPEVAWFYHDPRLTGVALASAAGILFNGLTFQHYALLVRQMRFGAMAVVQTLPMLTGAVVGVALAVAGWSYWALVVMGIAQAGTTALTAWIAVRWKPGLPNRNSGVGTMLAFGGHLTGFDVLSYLTRNADNILIGRFLGPGPLGIYAKAYGLLMFPVQQINAPVNGVVLPALSRLQHQPVQYRRYFLRAVEGLAFIGMPICMFSFVAAQPIVLVLLGPKWSGAVFVFRLLVPGALIGTINSAPAWIFTSLGRTGRQLFWAMLSTPTILVGFLIGLKWGTAGVAASFSISFCFCFALFTWDACRHSPVDLRDLAAALLVPLCASTLAAFVTYFSQCLLHISMGAKLASDGLVFVVAYACLCIAFPTGRSFLTLLLIRSGLGTGIGEISKQVNSGDFR